MAVAFQSEPVDDVNVTNQHLIYVLNDTVSTPDRYIVEVYEHNYFSGDGTRIAKVYITPNENNRGVFDLGDIVNNRLTQTTTVTAMGTTKFVHDIGSAEQASVTDMSARKYTLKAGGITGGVETFPNVPSSLATKYLINGAWQIKDGKHPAFTDFYSTAAPISRKVWLTNLEKVDARVTRYMAEEDQGRAQIMQHSLMGETCPLNRLTYSLYDSGGTLLGTSNLTISIQLYMPLCIRQVPMGPANVKAYMGAQWDDDWAYYDILPNQTGTKVGATMRVYKDCRPIKHEPVQLAWANSVGGWDLLRFDARAPKTIQKNEKRFRKDPLDWQATTTSWNPWDRGTTTFHNEGKIRFTLTHDQFTPDERALLEYCMRSRLVYYRYGTEDWAPCVVDTNSLVIEPAGSKMFRVSLVIEDANPVRC